MSMPRLALSLRSCSARQARRANSPPPLAIWSTLHLLLHTLYIVVTLHGACVRLERERGRGGGLSICFSSLDSPISRPLPLALLSLPIQDARPTSGTARSRGGGGDGGGGKVSEVVRFRTHANQLAPARRLNLLSLPQPTQRPRSAANMERPPAPDAEQPDWAADNDGKEMCLCEREGKDRPLPQPLSPSLISTMHPPFPFLTQPRRPAPSPPSSPGG